jgi:ubiquitin carboxyl-terminal hydrolase L3
MISDPELVRSIYLSLLEPGSLLTKLLDECRTLQPQDCALVLENSAELESIYNTAAIEGDSSVPTDAQEDVDFHFVCFVKNENSRIYELDGDRKGPVDKGLMLNPEDDMLSGTSIGVVKECIARERGTNFGFSLMA